MRALSLAAASMAAVLLAPLLLVAAVLTATGIAATGLGGPGGGVDPAAIPAQAAAALPTITATTAVACPQLPPVWVVAHVEAESGWNPAAFSRDTNGGAAGLYQLNQANWRSAGGATWATTPPPADADILQPELHLRRAIPWICQNLRVAATHLASTGKPTPALDGMLVCHIAGCARVTGSATGVPAPGEAGCDTGCSELVHRYLDRVHTLVARYSTPAGTPVGAAAPDPAPDAGTGCTAPDPTGGRCLTPTTRHAYEEIVRAFGPPGPAGPIRSAGCWDPHPQNPTSDHSRGRACDYFPAAPGQFPRGPDLAHGWRLATWLRTNAAGLHVKYVIWQGRIWTPGIPDDGGWGRPYTGGGIYDPDDATGGHYDHIHLSIDR